MQTSNIETIPPAIYVAYSSPERLSLIGVTGSEIITFWKLHKGSSILSLINMFLSACGRYT